jgi:erythronate-4-phosphate dehydrogenase
MKIVADQNIPFVQNAFAGFGEVVLVPGRSISTNVIADATVLLVRSVTPVTAGLLDGTSVKFVASATIGVEHVDREYLEKNRIGFAYAPGSNANSVAEYVIATMLLMAKKIGREPSDMIAGIIGVGNIGSRVYSYAEALGMRCLLNDPPKQRSLGNNVYRSLEETLECSDIITLHVPLETEGVDPTYRMINDHFLQQMKPGAVLINASRGKIMDDAGLLKYHGKLGGLVLDVWNNEPVIDPSICAIADIATPHIAGYSFDGKINGVAMIYKEACAFFDLPLEWDYRKIIGDRAGLIDCSGSIQLVFEAVTKTVPVLRDSASLKKIIQLPVEQRGKYFDSLRANYPKRLEFSHYPVASDHIKESEVYIMKKLGFEVIATNQHGVINEH